MLYNECENLKAVARGLFYKDASTLQDKVNAMLLVAEAHFERSKQANPEGHPQLEEFTQHWVWAAAHYWFGGDKAVVEELRTMYQRPGVLRMADGSSYWGTAPAGFVLLKTNDPFDFKPWHVEPEDRWRRTPPLNPNWEFVGIFETPTSALQAAFANAHSKTTSDKRKRSVTLSMRYMVLQRDEYRCQLCGASAREGVELEVDHRVPLAKGGSNDLLNLWVLCHKCNRGKGTRSI